MPLGSHRIQFDFRIAGVRYRPTLPWIPHEANLRRARQLLLRIQLRIRAGTFIFTEDFPQYRLRKTLRLPFSARTCDNVFDAFLHHEEARVRRGDLAPVTVTAHRQILDRVWRPAIGTMSLFAVRYSILVEVADRHRWTKKTYNNAISALRRAFDFGFQDHPEHHNPARALKSARIGKKDRPAIDPFSIQDAETLIAAIHREWGEAQGNYEEFRFFTGLRPSEQIALVVTDYDAKNGVLSVTKARVAGVDRDRTKIAEDRRVMLCPRAISVIERQLRLRECLERAGRLQHPYLFVHAHGHPIRDVRTVYPRWRRTLRRLAIRYRKPYAARHSSVSWDLMLGRNPLFVAQQHGHSVLTMLTVYAAWTRGSLEADVVAIRRALDEPAYATREGNAKPAAPGTPQSTEAVEAPPPIANAKSEAPAAANNAPTSTTDWAIDWPTADREIKEIPGMTRTWTGGADGTRGPVRPLASMSEEERAPHESGIYPIPLSVRTSPVSAGH
jgi:integrase